jgi:hypothetical protein
MQVAPYFRPDRAGALAILAQVTAAGAARRRPGARAAPAGPGAEEAAFEHAEAVAARALSQAARGRAASWQAATGLQGRDGGAAGINAKLGQTSGSGRPAPRRHADGGF